MENKPEDPNIPELIELVKELRVKDTKRSKKMDKLLENNLKQLEDPSKADKGPYLDCFFFIIFKHRLIIDEFISKVLYHLRKAQLYYSFPYVQQLEAAATKYFCDLYKVPPSSIQYFDKEEGKQMGAIAVITESDGHKTKFYLKTQRLGRRREEFGYVVPKAFDVRELFAYKVLEYLKICPEVHFFYHNEVDFYIGVKDANKDPETGEERFMCTYLELNKYLKGKNVDFVKFKESDEDSIPAILIDELTFSFIISLILVLSDTFSSFNNILYLGKDIDNLDTFQIIDFFSTYRVYKYDCSIFQAVINGMGVDERTKYTFIQYVLIFRDIQKKLQTIRKVFDPDLFNEAVEKAYEEVKKCPLVNLDALEIERINAHKKCNEFWSEFLSYENA